jgi:hypothetical protein
MKLCGNCIYARETVKGVNWVERSKSLQPVNRWGDGCDRYIEDTLKEKKHECKQ